jgi:hypothetical protein
MGRNVKIRVSYDHDAQFLLRLKSAIENDHARPLDWRIEVMGMLQELIEAFIQAPNPKVSSTDIKKASNE